MDPSADTDIVSDPTAKCYIDFEFQVPYYESLMASGRVQESIAVSMTDELQEIHPSSHLNTNDVKIQELCKSPESNHMKCKGWFSCLEIHRQMYVSTMKKIHRQKILSKKFIDVVMSSNPSNIRPNIKVAQLKITWSNERIINENDDIQPAKKSYEEYKAKHDESDGFIVIDEDIPSSELNRNSTIIKRMDDSSNGMESQIADTQNVDNITSHMNNNTLDTDLVVLDVQPSIFDVIHEMKTFDVDDESDEDSSSTEDIQIVDDTQVNILKSELKKTKSELIILKREHMSDMTHLHNRITHLKTQEMSAKSREISRSIDEEYLRKQLIHDNDGQIEQLRDAYSKLTLDKKHTLQTIEVTHKKEIKRLKSKIKQLSSYYNLDVENTRKQHRQEVTQLKSQMRTLQSSLDRESNKDRKMEILMEELESAKLLTTNMNQEYEQIIDNLNKDNETEMQQEINKRIKESSQMRREIADLKQTVQQLKNAKMDNEREIRTVKQEIQHEQNLYQHITNILKKEQLKTASLEKRILRLRKKIQSTKVPRNSRVDGDFIEDVPHHTRVRSLTTRKNSVTIMDDGTQSVIVVQKMDRGALKTIDYHSDEDSQSDNEIVDEEYISTKKYNFISEEIHDQRTALKESEISGLKEKILRLEDQIRQLKKTHTEYISTLQQKIGSLQESEAIAYENFMKQKQMLEYKLQSRIQQKDKIDIRVRKLLKKHKTEIKTKETQMNSLSNELGEKDMTIQSLNQNIEFLEQQVHQLHNYQEEINACEYELANYEEDYNTLIVEIEHQKTHLNDKEKEIWEIKHSINKKDVENANLQNVVHKHKETITNLEELIHDMRLKEEAIEINVKKTHMIENEIANMTTSTGRSNVADGGYSSRSEVANVPMHIGMGYNVSTDSSLIVGSPLPHIFEDNDDGNGFNVNSVVAVDEQKYQSKIELLVEENNELKEVRMRLESELNLMKEECGGMKDVQMKLEIDIMRMREDTVFDEHSKMLTLQGFSLEMDRLREQIKRQNSTLQRVYDKRQARKIRK